jgi:prolyl-tRNA editing enzyme YbaK/EbsC (Cys-tRNA(Pro) deacylase)
MSEALSASAQKIQDALIAHGLECRVVQLPASCRTAQEAALAIGCRVEQIVKSLIFRGAATGKAVLVLASGMNRVNEKKIAEFAGEEIAKADAEFVREKTGFVIGGVPPLAHRESLETWIDETLFDFEELWAAAGTPFAVFRLTAAELRSIVSGQIISIK